MSREHTLGYYKVGNQQFLNKIHALMYAKISGLEPTWHFSDNIFSKYDWSVPVEIELTELYKRRAQQLRDKYDFVSLFYSGGVDSTNVLHSFLDNDIPLDEIVMWIPLKLIDMANKNDRSAENSYSEIVHAAIPYLHRVLKNSNTKIRFIDIAERTNYLLNNSEMLSQYSASLNSVGSLIIPKLSMALLDSVWNDLYLKGKNVCHIQAHDKPMVKYSIKDGYTFRFQDTMSWSYKADFISPTSDMIEKCQHHELFYWSPDLPELVIKQCQMVKARALKDPLFAMMLGTVDSVSSDGYLSLNRVVYSKEVLSVRDLFAVGKGGWGKDFEPWNWKSLLLSNYSRGAYSELLNNSSKILGNFGFRGKGKYAFYKDRITNNIDASRNFALAFFHSIPYKL